MRDHEELDRALVAMVDDATPPDEMVTLLEVFRLALAVHVAAEAAVWKRLLAHTSLPESHRTPIITQGTDDHTVQQCAAGALLHVRPHTAEWFARALELRVMVLEHTSRTAFMSWTLLDHVPTAMHRGLASDYATERLRVLSRTSPQMIAQARLAHLHA